VEAVRFSHPVVDAPAVPSGASETPRNAPALFLAPAGGEEEEPTVHKGR
jgi:hypothetical protein